jgi:hypothetical protein
MLSVHQSVYSILYITVLPVQQLARLYALANPTLYGGNIRQPYRRSFLDRGNRMAKQEAARLYRTLPSYLVTLKNVRIYIALPEKKRKGYS